MTQIRFSRDENDTKFSVDDKFIRKAILIMFRLLLFEMMISLLIKTHFY